MFDKDVTDWLRKNVLLNDASFDLKKETKFRYKWPRKWRKCAVQSGAGSLWNVRGPEYCFLFFFYRMQLDNF